jgi:outer membrane immunogenic protein
LIVEPPYYEAWNSRSYTVYLFWFIFFRSFVMKTTLAAAAAILIASTAAGSAADLAVKAPYIAPTSVWSWTGFYIGGHVGAGWGTTEATLDSITAPGTPLTAIGAVVSQNSRSGFLGGGQAGYNFQSGWAVFGIQGDIAGLDVKGTTPCLTTFLSCTAQSHWLATATGRIGGLVADKTLIYVKGGGAWLNTTHTFNIPAGIGALGGLTGTSADSNTFGWLLGFGAEYAFTPNWSAFIEYDYIDFDSKSIALNLTVPGVGTAAANVSVVNKLSIAKVGANYKF